MTDPIASHEEFAETLSAYAVDALDDAERTAFEVHLSWCRQCQADLAELRRVAAGLGLAADPVDPPDALKEKTIARATGQTQRRPTTSFAPARREPAARRQWGLLIAAGVALFIATAIYAVSLRFQMDTLQQTLTREAAGHSTSREQLVQVRRDLDRLAAENAILTAPDTVRVRLQGREFAANAAGVAFWSSSRGLMFSAERLPNLEPGRVYQLWVIPPGAPPVSAGTLTLRPDGSSTQMYAAAGLPNAVNVAVSVEPAGGSLQPTGAIVLANF
jgi:anti-sigma factor RsiW